MTGADLVSNINLKDLRSRLTADLAVVLILASGVLVWMLLIERPFPGTAFALLIFLMSLGSWTHAMVTTHPSLARRALVWGLTGILLAAILLLPTPWIPFLGVVVTLVGAFLLSRYWQAIPGLIVLLTLWLNETGARGYPMRELVATFLCTTAIIWLTVRTLYTALQWAWNMQQRADRLLESSRDDRGRLAAVLKSVNTANALLRRTQYELLVARKEADEARAVKERFAAHVSHELRTPLNLIIGFSEMMTLSPEVYGEVDWPPTLREDIGQIYLSSCHLLDMVDDVLELSRFEATGFTLSKRPTPLEPLLAGCVDIARDLFRGRPVQLKTEISDNLPVLVIDAVRIRQALLNLLTNAARFTEQGTVLVEALRSGSEVMICVHDTGTGIPANQVPHLFEEFYQVDRSFKKRREKAGGLGLAISKRFVEAHGGRIWAESEEGVGSTFAFALPIPAEHTALARLHSSRAIEPLTPITHPTILVIDPDPSVATLIERHLNSQEVIQVSEAQLAAEMIIVHHPKAVIWNVQPDIEADWNMVLGGIDGLASVPLIQCSLPSQAWMARYLDVDAFLVKPVTAERLRKELETFTQVEDVLVVDDNPGFCELVRRVLTSRDSNVRVRLAYDGAGCLYELHAQQPDLLFLDLIMPEIDGFQVLRSMAEEPELARVRVIVVTGTDYAEYALGQHTGRLVISNSSGLQPVKALRYLAAVTDFFDARYYDQQT